MRQIISDPNFLHGKPYLGGVRLSVELILEHLAQKMSIHEIARKYPQLTEEDVIFTIQYAARVVSAHPEEADIQREARDHD